jgi:predicted RecB family nuclease
VTGRATTLDPGAAARCAFRTVLEHDLVDPVVRSGRPDDTRRRRADAASVHRLAVKATLLELHGDRALDARGDVERTLRALVTPGLDVVVDPALPPDPVTRRHGSPSVLIAEPNGGSIAWRPVDVHNHFLTAQGSGEFRASSLAAPTVAAADRNDGRRLRKGGAWRRDVLRLAHHHRRLESLGATGAARPIGGIVDRSATLWWLALDEALDDRGAPLAQYDARFAERVALLEATEARARDASLPRPGAPWWHRECEECPFATTCHGTLSAVDDVSLVRFTSAPDQAVLRDLGVATRRSLAALDLDLVARGAATRDEPSDADEPMAVSVGRRLKDADRLVRRARVEVAGSLLRAVDAAALDARRADVEIDFDMESYSNATYLWGTLVTVRSPTPGVASGYRAFAEWGELTELAEGALFAAFYAWLRATVRAARDAGRTVGLYCFWEHAERAQMQRAMGSGAGGLPTRDELHDVLLDRMVDLHAVVTTQIQTAGPAGLKVVAGAAGFRWRDDAPSGEASMGWYEEARGADPVRADAAMRRILAYNEDDCSATRALRDWLEGAARDLQSVEEARPSDS